MSGDIAVGVKVFSRVEKLGRLLSSIEPSPIDTVYVADDGEMTDEKTALYDREFDFDLTVFDLPYDAGLGQGRAHIVENLAEEYLLVVDSDHELLGDVTALRDQLEADDRLGGVAGLLYENENVVGTCHDLHRSGNLLVRTVPEPKEVRLVGGEPFLPYDFVPNAALFRRACLDAYCWDPEYVIGKEHLDFYEGHRRRTDWLFGVNPTVLFGHHPGGDSRYVENRDSYEKLQRSRRYFLDKWDYDRIVLGYTDWEDRRAAEPDWAALGTDVAKKLLLAAPASVQAPVQRARDAVRRWRRLPPL
jgi:hypothetical protein